MKKSVKILNLYIYAAVCISLAVPLLAQGVLAQEADTMQRNALDAFFPQDQSELLTNDEAFHLLAELEENNGIKLLIQTPPGYFLYKKRLAATLDSPNYHLGEPSFTGVEQLDDGLTGMAKVLADGDTILLPLLRKDLDASPIPLPETLILQVQFQGCAKDRFCYPPAKRVLTIKTRQEAY